MFKNSVPCQRRDRVVGIHSDAGAAVVAPCRHCGLPGVVFHHGLTTVHRGVVTVCPRCITTSTRYTTAEHATSTVSALYTTVHYGAIMVQTWCIMVQTRCITVQHGTTWYDTVPLRQSYGTTAAVPVEIR